VRAHGRFFAALRARPRKTPPKPLKQITCHPFNGIALIDRLFCFRDNANELDIEQTKRSDVSGV
jgi:hypothetical protein